MTTHYTPEGGSNKRSSKKRLLNFLAIFVPLIGITVGAYMLVVIFSPSMINVPFVTGKDPEETSKKLTQAAGLYGDRLFIPQINVDVAIVTGKDESVLNKGAWHRKPEQGDPTKTGNFILSAHRFEMGVTPQQTAAKSPFYNINKLKIGDQIYVDYQGKRYAYEIEKKYEVAPTSVAIEDQSKEAKMTLYSCTLGGSSDGRDVFDAKPLGEIAKLEVSSR